MRRHRPLPREARLEPCRVNQARYRAPGLDQPWASCASGQSCRVWSPIGWLRSSVAGSHPATLRSLKSLGSADPFSRAACQPTGTTATPTEQVPVGQAAYSLCSWEIR